MNAPPLHPIRKSAWVYAILFVAVVSLGYIPGFTTPEGHLFGLFHIELKDDLLHLGSGIWAAVAAWLSTRAATLYFQIFGIVYGLDGLVGLIFGQGYLDLGIFLFGPAALDLGTKIATNIPHIVIGGSAALVGFVLSRQWVRQTAMATLKT